jgi:high affinity Mn2+ porin
MNRAPILASATAALVAIAVPLMARAANDGSSQTSGDEETWAVHGQLVVVAQGHPAFRSPYEGENSLDPRAVVNQSVEATLFVGVRPWKGAEIWANPEVDQGFGLSNTVGVAGFPNGASPKVGSHAPYVKLPRVFLRQTVNLGRAEDKVSPNMNQLGSRRAEDRIVFTIGKFSVSDIFDANQYAHDSRRDFMNWTFIDAGTFDYAGNAWGYTYGAAAEWYHSRWAARLGVFDLSDIPNSTHIDPHFDEFQLAAELEESHEIGQQPGRLRVTFFNSRGRMARYDDAVQLAITNGAAADPAPVRKYRSRSGVSFSFEQQIGNGIGTFMRAGRAGGEVEPFDFTDVDQTWLGGVSVGGRRWGRPDDTFALALCVNGISPAHQRYLDTGGLGILVGDSRLPHPGAEQILETYYDASLTTALHLSLDFQFVRNPSYNRDRGPVPIGAVRLTAGF